MNMIPVFVVAVGFALLLRAKPLGISVQHRFAPHKAAADQGLRAEDILSGGGPYTLIIRAVAIALCAGGLVLMWGAVHSAMAR